MNKSLQSLTAAFLLTSLTLQMPLALAADQPKLSEVLKERLAEYKATFPTFTQSEFDLTIRAYHFTRKIDVLSVLAANTKKVAEMGDQAFVLANRSEQIQSFDFPRLYHNQKRLEQLEARAKRQEAGIEKTAAFMDQFCADSTLSWADRFFVPSKLFAVESWDLPGVQGYIPVSFGYSHTTNGQDNQGSVSMQSNDPESAAIIGVSTGVGCAIGTVVPVIGNVVGSAVGMAVGVFIVAALAAGRAADEQHKQNDIVNEMREFSRSTIQNMDVSARNKLRETCLDLWKTDDRESLKTDFTSLKLNAFMTSKAITDAKDKLTFRIKNLEIAENSKLKELSEEYFQRRLESELAAADQRLKNLQKLDASAEEAWNKTLSKTQAKVKLTKSDRQRPYEQDRLLDQLLLVDAQQSPADAPPAWLMDESTNYRRR